MSTQTSLARYFRAEADQLHAETKGGTDRQPAERLAMLAQYCESLDNKDPRVTALGVVAAVFRLTGRDVAAGALDQLASSEELGLGAERIADGDGGADFELTWFVRSVLAEHVRRVDVVAVRDMDSDDEDRPDWQARLETLQDAELALLEALHSRTPRT